MRSTIGTRCLLLGLLALGAIVVACQGAEEVVTPTATPSTQAQARQRLADLSADAVLALAFPGINAIPPIKAAAGAIILTLLGSLL